MRLVLGLHDDEAVIGSPDPRVQSLAAGHEVRRRRQLYTVTRSRFDDADGPKAEMEKDQTNVN